MFRSLPAFELTWRAPAGRQCGQAIYIDCQDTLNRKGNVIMAKKTAYEIVPQLGKLRDEVLFGDVWEQPELSKRDRSLVTISVLTALYRTDELRGHMKRALDNGVTQDEIRGMITHLAFYAGWPTAVNAGRIAVEVFEDD